MKSFAICICPFSCPEVHGFSFLSCWQACVWPAVLGRGLLGPRAFPLLFLQVFQSPEGVCETVQHPARVRGCGPLGVLVLECVWLESEQDEGSLDFGVLAEVLAWAKKIYIRGFYQAWGKIQASSQHWSYPLLLSIRPAAKLSRRWSAAFPSQMVQRNLNRQSVPVMLNTSGKSQR